MSSPKKAWPPSMNLKPLYSGGLCEPVTMIAPSASRVRGGKVEHRCRTQSGARDAHARLGQAARHGLFERGRAGATVVGGEGASAAAAGDHRTEGAAERPGVIGRDALADDTAHVVLAEDGWIEVVGVGHGARVLDGATARA